MYSPAEGDGDNTSFVLSDLEKHGHGKVEVGARRVAPAAIVVGQSEVWRTEVGGSDEDGGVAWVAPFGVISTLNLKAGSAAEAIVEQSCAQGRRVDAVALAVEVSVPTSTACKTETNGFVKSLRA